MSEYRVVRRLMTMVALAGLATGGCSSDDGDDGDDGTDGGAVMKYCNGLVAEDPVTMAEIPLELTVIFAGVEATAMSGECTPIVDSACIPIPAGPNPAVVLEDPSTNPPTELASGTFLNFSVADGDELLVIATIDGTTMMPTVEAGTFDPDFACAETDPFAEMLETRSAPFDVRSQLTLRTQQNLVRTRWMRTTVPVGLER